MTKLTTLSDLEDRLAADPDGHLRGEMLNRLSAEVTALGRLQREQQPAARYASLERQRLACLAAMRVIEQVWRRLHQL